MLELVQPGRSAARRRRTGADRRHHPPNHARTPGRSGTGVCRRPVGRRGRCGDHGGCLPRSLCRRRRAFRVAVLDGIPILERLERCDARFAQTRWHWFFCGQPDNPERAITADPDAWYGASAQRTGANAYADFLEAIHDPATVHGMVEDYRVGLGIDRDHDAQDREQGRRIACPALCLWSLRDGSHELAGDMLGIWRSWASDVRGRGIDCTHHMAEEAPEALARELLEFLDQNPEIRRRPS